MIEKILNKVWQIKLFYKYINFNKNNLIHINSKKKETREIILLELFDIKAFILSSSLFCTALKSKKNYKIIGYFPNFLRIKNEIKFLINWYFNIFSSMQFFKSFGMTKFIIPKKNSQSKNLLKTYNKIINNIKSKKDVLNLKIDSVLIGDIVYDTYLRENDLITINISDKKFKEFIFNTVCLFYTWKSFFKKNKVNSIISSHSVYLTALPLRVAMKYNINTFCVNHHGAYRLSKKKPLVWGNFEDYPKLFKALPNTIKKKGVLFAKSNLTKRFTGHKDILYKISNPIKKSIFLPEKRLKKKVIKESKNFKILIAAHDFNDAPHVHKDLIFEDMYEWLNYLGELSNSKEHFDWYIKLHPSEYDENYEKMKFIINKYNKLKLLPKYISHNQIVKEGINCVLTCYGSIGHEYPFFKIPVINAGHNPHIGYNFNYNPKNKKEYDNLISQIRFLKVNKNYKNQIYEFYTVRFFLDYALFNDIHDAKLFNEMYIFDIFLKRFDEKKIKKTLKDYSTFIMSKKRRLINYDQIN
tara:strand:- start:248 stop:1825 length:1578 start_codon:yes stop_codon:yes gene_type:complete